MELVKDLLHRGSHDLLVSIVFLDALDGSLGLVDHGGAVDGRSKVLELLDQQTVRGDRLILESSEGHLGEHTHQVFVGDNLAIDASLTITSAAKSTSSSVVSGPTLNLNVPIAYSGGTFIAFRIEEYDIVWLEEE